MDEKKEVKTGTPTGGKVPSLGLNLGLIALAAAWMGILARNPAAKLERWLASGVLALVGITGLAGFVRARLARARRAAATVDGEGAE